MSRYRINARQASVIHQLTLKHGAVDITYELEGKLLIAYGNVARAELSKFGELEPTDYKHLLTDHPANVA